jgi:hypothetical protein
LAIVKWTLREFSCKTDLAHAVQHFPVPTKIGCLVVLSQILGYVICCLVFKMCLQVHRRELITHVPKK